MELMSYKTAVNEQGSAERLKTALAEKTIFKIKEGVYSKEKNPPESAVVCFEYPRAVITMLSAFYHHGLTDSIPEKVDVAIPSSARAPHNAKIRVYYSPRGHHEPGVIIEEKHGYPIRVYCKERMLIELLRNKESMPYDLYKEVLSNYRRIVESLDLRLIDDLLEGFPKARLIQRRLMEEVL